MYSDIPHGLETALRADGYLWTDLTSSASEIILFGSRATSGWTSRSDWDLLCVGRGRTRRGRAVDVLWITPECLASDEWLGSELASHVSHYGRWLFGQGTWCTAVGPSSAAVARKLRRVRQRLDGMVASWSRLTLAIQAKHVLLLRRDLQRLDLLRGGEPIPSAPLLDAAWRAEPSPSAALERLCTRHGLLRDQGHAAADEGLSAFVRALVVAGVQRARRGEDAVRADTPAGHGRRPGAGHPCRRRRRGTRALGRPVHRDSRRDD